MGAFLEGRRNAVKVPRRQSQVGLTTAEQASGIGECLPAWTFSLPLEVGTADTVIL